MNSLLRPFTRLKLTPRLVEPIRVPVRPLSVSAGLEYYAGGKYHRIEGFSSGGRTPWRNGYGMMTKEFKFNKVHSPTAVRIKEFKRNPQLTRSVEDIPMFWMLRPLGEGETDLKSGELVKDSDNVEIWKKNTWKRGMEHPQQKIEDGPTYRFKHWTAQKASRRRRLQLQYDIHLNRLRALYKNEVLPKTFRNQAREQMWMLNCGRFSRLKKDEREYLVCRIHGRPGGGIRPRWGIKRQPMRLLIDYGEGVCGVQWDFYCRRQREFWTDYLRRKPCKRRTTRQWHRDETYHRYRSNPFYNQTGSVQVNSQTARSDYGRRNTV